MNLNRTTDCRLYRVDANILLVHNDIHDHESSRIIYKLSRSPEASFRISLCPVRINSVDEVATVQLTLCSYVDNVVSPYCTAVYLLLSCLPRYTTACRPAVHFTAVSSILFSLAYRTRITSVSLATACRRLTRTELQ